MSTSNKDINKKLENLGTSQKGKGSAYANPKEDPKYRDKWLPQNLVEYKNSVYNKISELLLKQWSKIEPFLDGVGIEAIQKKYQDGSLVTGRNRKDMMVVYESDVEANPKDEKVEGALLSWLDFINPSMLKLKVVETIEVADEGKPLPPNLILQAPNKTDLNINEIIGTLELSEINIKDNISQFMKLDKVKTNLNRNKLIEVVDTDFGELTPLTFTNLLERYNKLGLEIPMRYRSDSFWEEYANSNLSTGYRINKLFEEFERLKSTIPKGKLISQGDYSPTLSGIENDDQLFGWETLTYMVSEAQDIIGTANPIFSQIDARSWLNRIDALEADKVKLEAIIEALRRQIEALLARYENLGSTDEVIEYDVVEPEAEPKGPGVSIRLVGTGYNNNGPRILEIEGTLHYSSTQGQGLRMVVISAASVANGVWDGTTIWDKTYDVMDLAERERMSTDILQGDWQFNDIFTVTSYGEVNYDPLLVEALKTIGGCYPRIEAAKVGDTDANWNYRTPYALIGSFGLGECGGFEDVQDDGMYTKPAQIAKFWIPDEKGEGGWDTEGPDPIMGCTDPTADNFSVTATMDDGSCQYAPYVPPEPEPFVPSQDPKKGCMDRKAENYNKRATEDDGSCKYPPVFKTSFEGGNTPCLPSQWLYDQRGGIYQGLVEDGDAIHAKYDDGSYQLIFQDPEYPKGMKGTSNGLNQAIKFGDNPGDSEYVLMQDGWKSNECEILINGVHPNTWYTITAWVSYNEQYNGCSGCGTFSARMNSSKGRWDGGSLGSNDIGIVKETKVIQGRTWYKHVKFFKTNAATDMGTGHWYLGWNNTDGNYNTKVPLYDKDCSYPDNIDECGGRRYYTGLKWEVMSQSDYPNFRQGGVVMDNSVPDFAKGGLMNIIGDSPIPPAISSTFSTEPGSEVDARQQNIKVPKFNLKPHLPVKHKKRTPPKPQMRRGGKIKKSLRKGGNIKNIRKRGK